MTNGDKIRSMSNGELAILFSDMLLNDEELCDECPIDRFGRAAKYNFTKRCSRKLEAWLCEEEEE